MWKLKQEVYCKESRRVRSAPTNISKHTNQRQQSLSNKMDIYVLCICSVLECLPAL
jgi:hypothetical protein